MANTTVTAEAVNAADRRHIETTGHDPIDHRHGDMDIRAHERTYNGFISTLVWSLVSIIAILIFLVLANA